MPPGFRGQRHFDVADVIHRIARTPQSRDPIEEAELQRLVALQMVDDFEAGDFRAALDTAELLLAWNEEHEVAQRIAEDSRMELEAEAANAIGSFDAIPTVRATGVEIEALDPGAAYLLSYIDGKRTIEEVLDSVAMPATAVIRLLHWLVFYGLVELDVPRR